MAKRRRCPPGTRKTKRGRKFVCARVKPKSRSKSKSRRHSVSSEPWAVAARAERSRELGQMHPNLARRFSAAMKQRGDCSTYYALRPLTRLTKTPEETRIIGAAVQKYRQHCQNLIDFN